VEARQPIQEILPADEKKRLQDSAEDSRNRARLLVMPVEQFLKQSLQAEAGGDLRLADQLAQRAYTLAKDLAGGK
jgi:hypothetical protein